jgi:hypothetical protein
MHQGGSGQPGRPFDVLDPSPHCCLADLRGHGLGLLDG